MCLAAKHASRLLIVVLIVCNLSIWTQLQAYMCTYICIYYVLFDCILRIHIPNQPTVVGWDACSKFHGPLVSAREHLQEKNVSFADLGTFSLNSYPFSPILKACDVSTFSINRVVGPSKVAVQT